MDASDGPQGPSNTPQYAGGFGGAILLNRERREPLPCSIVPVLPRRGPRRRAWREQMREASRGGGVVPLKNLCNRSEKAGLPHTDM